MSAADKLAARARSLSVSVITGGVGTGKTEEIIQRVATLLENGDKPSDIAIFAATKSACLEIARRLSRVSDDKAANVCIRTMLEQELLILSTPEAVAFSERKPRVLLQFEQNVLMEDLKTSRVQPRRLAEMLRFFYRSWADLETMDSSWFYNDEEERVYRILERHLKFMDAYLPSELARAAHDYAVNVGRSASVAHFSHVFIDDYQKLSRASQNLAAMLAADTLTVAGDSYSRARGLEEFPHPQGLAEFIERHPECEHLQLTESHQATKVTEAVNALAGDQVFGADSLSPAGDASEGAFSLHEFATPHDELNGIARLIEQMLSGGASAESIAVTAPTNTWIGYIARTLKAHGIPVSLVRHVNIGGDIRSIQACPEARAFSLLRLAANPYDQAALRCWCGFGDYLANSSLFASIVENGQRLTLDNMAPLQSEARKALDAQEFERVSASLDQARAILQRIEPLGGEDLVQAVLREVEAEAGMLEDCLLVRIARSLSNDATAEIICAKAEELSLLPASAGRGVVVCLPEELAGQSKDTVVVAGLVNGFSPAASYFDATAIERDKRPALLAKEITRLYECAGKARRSVAFSYFTSADLVSAEKLRLKVYRVRLIDGKRMCEIHPSDTIGTLIEARPND